MGGSFAMNLYLDSRAELIRELEESGVFGDEQIHVFSIAMSGWKQPQQLQALSYLLAQGASFDVIVNLDGFNEVALPFSENDWTGAFPFYPRAWRSYAARSRMTNPDLLSLARLTQAKEQSRRWRQLFGSSAIRHSRAALLILEVFDRRNRQAFLTASRELERSAASGSDAESVESFGPRRNYDTSERFFDDVTALWERASRQLAALCEANGIAYLHFLQPNQYVPDSKPMKPEEKAIAFGLGDEASRYRRSVEEGYPMLDRRGQELRQDGIHFVNLAPLFQDIEAPLYEDTCCHVNKQGIDLVARRIAAEIASARARDSTP